MNEGRAKEVIITLSVAEFDFLCEILGSCEDEGPPGMGWRSKELIALMEKLETFDRRITKL